MLFLIILPILVSGYILFNKHPYYYYRLHRYNGQLLYLASAFNGLISTILSFFVIAIIKKYTPEAISIPIDKLLNNLIIEITKENSITITWIIIGSINSFIIAYMWSMLAKIKLMIKVIGIRVIFNHIIFRVALDKNKINYKNKGTILLMSTILNDSPMIKSLLESYIEGHLLMLTLADRKVYVGRVISLGEPTETSGIDKEITITPFMSGYRDKDNLTINFTTKYEDINKNIYLTIKQENILSSTKYIAEVYDEFKKNEIK